MISDKSAKISLKLFVTLTLVLAIILGIKAVMVSADIPDVWYCSSTTAESGAVYKVCTELDDYSPESTVFIKGNGYAPDTSLTIRVTRPDGSIITGDGSCFTEAGCGEWPTAYDTVTVDSLGEFHYDYVLDGIVGRYYVDVLDTDGNVIAGHSFLDDKSLTVILTNGGGGNVVSNPAGINCGLICSHNFNNNQQVVLTATPTSGGSFAGWSGACTNTVGTCTVTMNTAKSVNAAFTFPLTITNAGGGTVTSAPSGIDCGATCSKQYVYGTSITLTASPSAGYYFSGWSGACGGNGQCSFTMSTAKTTTATFTAQKANGLSCGANNECANNVCADGYCCASSCSGTCEACNLAGREGFCDPIPAGTDPIDECSLQAASTCGTTGMCSGSRSCAVYTAGTECRASGGSCDVAETCAGTGATCPINTFLPSTTECRGSAGECDAAETCTGSSAICPNDAFQPNTVTCTGASNGGACDGIDKCSGTANTCVDKYLASSTVCRASADTCDAAETCTGDSSTCPTDAFVSSSTTCRASVGVCDLAESCTGNGAACPSDLKSTSQCRASAGVCDVVENCNGVDNNCPEDVFEPSSTVCRPEAAGGCDVAESCTGSSASCPLNSFQAINTPCGDPASCSVSTFYPADVCNGVGACTNPASQSCNPYVCGSSVCLSSCTAHSDCSANYYCIAGTCQVDITAPVISWNLPIADTYFKNGNVIHIDASVTESGSGITDNADCNFDAQGSIIYTGSVNYNKAQGKCLGDITVTSGADGARMLRLSLTDIAGNTGQTDHLRIFIDNTAPTLIGAPTTAANGNGWYKTDVTVHFTCTDTGSGVQSVTLDQTLTSEGAGQHILGTCTDNLGNTATYDVTGINIDKTAPVITVTGNNPASIEALSTYTDAGATVSDNLDLTVIVTSTGSVNTNLVGDYTIYYDAVDVAGNNAAQKSRLIHVIDSVPPVIAIHGNENAEATSSAGAVVTYTNPTATDNYDATVTVNCAPASGSNFGLGDTIVTCDAQDAAGNHATSTNFHVYVVDTKAPVISGMPSDMTVEGPTSTGADVSWTAPTANDIVDGSVAVVCLPASGSHFAMGDTTVTCTSTDAHSNTATASFIVTVEDTTPPTLTVTGAMANGESLSGDLETGFILDTSNHPSDEYLLQFAAGTIADETLNNEYFGLKLKSSTVSDSDLKAYYLARGVPEPYLSYLNDAVDKVKPFVYINGNTVKLVDAARHDLPPNADTDMAIPANFPLGTYVVEGKIKDLAGNEAIVTLTIIVVGDRIPPVISVPADITAEATGPNGAAVDYTVTANDAGDGEVTPICTPASGSTFALDATTVNCEATDLHYNKATASFKVTVVDTTAPVLTVPTDITKEATAVNTPVTWTAPTATDLVDENVAVTCTKNSGDTFTVGDTIVNCEATDAHTNKGTASFKVTITDTTPPPAPDPVSPADGSFFRTATLTMVDWTDVSDVNGVSNPVTYFYESAKSSALNSDGSFANRLFSRTTSASQNPAGGTPEGTWYWHARAIDARGNAGAWSTAWSVIVDNTPPVISGLPDRAANSNGWYNTDVIVTFTCTDALSGVDTFTSPITLGEGQAQSATGTCTDKSGNSASTTVSGINIDKTAPIINGAPTTAANANGWYKNDVIVHYTCADALSGLDSLTGDHTLSTEAASQSTSGTCTDKAGNSADKTVSGINIDKTAPTVTATPDRATDFNDWYNHAVTIKFVPGSDLSGIQGCDPDVAYSSPDTETASVSGTCTDKAENVGTGTLNFKYDATEPIDVLLTATGTAGSNNWFIGDVTITTTGSDLVSGVTCTGVQNQNVETQDKAFNGYCTNGAGLRTDAPAITVKMDKTGPSAALGVTAGTAGANGWYTSDVTVSTTGTDSISSPVTCTIDQYQTTETTGADFIGECTNDAGLSTNAAPLNVKLDKTAPTANLAVTAGTLGSNGWYTSDVTVSSSGADSISGPVKCTADQFQTTETTGTIFNAACTNDAGLTTNAAPLNVKLDKTGPSATLAVTAGTAGTNGWYTSDVTIHTSGEDLISDNVICTADQYQTTETTGQVFNAQCTNGAGLTTNAAPLTIKLDKTGPTASLAVTSGTLGLNNWYTSDVTVSTTGTDSISTPVTCTPVQSQTTDTDSAGHEFTGSCTNDAGLTTNAASLTIKRDATKPVITITTPSSDYILNQVVAANFGCTDATPGSGLTSCVGTVANGANINTASVGPKDFIVNAADEAGNTATKTFSYKVLYATGTQCLGSPSHQILQPINSDDSSVFKKGSTVPAKFRVCDANGVSIGTPGVITDFKLVAKGINLATLFATAEEVDSTTPFTEFRWSSSDQQWIFNINTKSLSATYRYRYLITLNDGSTIPFSFSLK